VGTAQSNRVVAVVDLTQAACCVAIMGTTYDEVVAAAVSLPPEVRAMLASSCSRAWMTLNERG